MLYTPQDSHFGTFVDASLGGSGSIPVTFNFDRAWAISEFSRSSLQGFIHCQLKTLGDVVGLFTRCGIPSSQDMTHKWNGQRSKADTLGIPELRYKNW